MKIALVVACVGFGLLIAERSSGQQTEAAPKSHVMPVGDAGVGLVVMLPQSFTMEQTRGSHFYFGKAVGGAGPEIWVYVFVDFKRATESTLK
jgi:hypothetical protein